MSSDTNVRFVPEPERYEFRAGSIHHFELARRDFFKFMGAGIAVFAVAKDALAKQETAPTRGFHSEELPQAITAWLHIGEGGKVTAFTGKVEIGQNIRTSLAQTVADELHVSFESVTMVTADTALTPFDFGTVGSRSMPTMAPQLRRVSNAARELLVAAAAKEWSVAVEGLTTADGKVTNPATGKSLRYGELARGKTLAQNLPAEDPVTPPDQWTIAGKPVPKKDARLFVTGQHQYTPDMSRPGMLYGKVLRPPSFSATLTSYDASAVQSKNGVVLVHDGDFIAAAAPTEREAQQTVDAIRTEWKEVPQTSSKELFAYLKQNASTKENERGRHIKGSMDAGLAAAAHRLDATYTVAFIAHAPLEPRAALAEWTDGKLTVWTGSQRPFAVRDELASVFHIGQDNVRVIVPDTGAAYGGKHTGDAAVEAARLARAAGRPVKIVWTREEEFTWAYFRPAGVIEIKSGVGADGVLTAWEFHNYNSGASAIDTPYVVPNQHIEFHSTQCPLRSGSYRGLAATGNFFARESHMDTLAHAAQMEPLAFRLKNLDDPRLRAVLEAAAKAFGWPGKKTTDGQGFGIAGGHEKGGYVATCAEVMVNRSSGAVRIVRLTTAFECGAIVNPDGLRNQVVGANIQGLGGALFEAIEFENGRITNPRFSRYRVPRFKDAPEIEAVLLDRKDLPSAGAGETPIMGVAPAIGNAIFDATGTRITSMPMVPNGIPISKA
ncbi:MAG TPA: molybdopterin cofactor-binding domain-containing protein [Candidatus Methylomirabilis sp.]|nr:molybdopterin cofactor-binding domain-containing protein [Candidatus Methylomirabilis sp.]